MLRSLAAAGKVNWASNVHMLLYTYAFRYVWEADSVGDGVQFIHIFNNE